MTISFVGPTSPVTGQTPTVNIPTGVVEGDLLILVINGQGLTPPGGELPAPSGWSVKINDFGPLHVYYKFASSSETPVTLNLNNTATCNILGYRNAKMSTSSSSVRGAITGTEITTYGQDTNTKYNFILRFYSCDSGNVTSFTVPEFTTSRINFSSTLTNRGMLLTDEFQSEIATSPERTTTVSTVQTNASAYSFSIEPKDTLNPGINFIGSGSVVTGASPTLNVPAGVIAGDTLIILSSTTVDPTTPTGWTVKSFVSGSFRIYMAIKTATSSESSVTLNGLSADATSVMLAYSGVDPSKTGNTVRTDFGTVMESPAEGTSSANSYIFRAWVCDSGGNTEFEIVNLSSSRLNSRINFSGTLTTRGLASTDELQDESGAVPERIVFLSTDRSWTALVWPMEPKRNLYWVGGSGTWDTSSATNWSLTSGGSGGEALPTSVDNVIVDNNSGSPIITLSESLSCASLTTTGATCTLTSTGDLAISEGMTLSANTTWSATGLLTLNGTGTVTTNGVSISSPITIDATGSTITLSGSLTTTKILTLTNGTLNLNGFDASCLTYSGSNTNARGIAFGNNFINITGTDTATVLNITTTTGFTPTGAGGFKLTGAAASGVTRTIVIGTTDGSVATAPNVFVAAGASDSIVAITNNSWVRDLNFTGFSGTFTPSTNTYNIAGSFTLSDAMLYTINDNTTYNFVATTTGHTIHLASPVRQIGNVVFNGVGGEWTMLTLLRCTGSNITLTSGTLNLNNNGTTCRTWTCTGTGVRSIAFGSSGIVEAAGLGTITSINFANLTNFSYTGTSRIFVAGNSTGTATINIGTTGGNETNAMNVQIAFGSGGRIFTFTSGSVIRDLNVASLAGTFAPPATLTIFGSLVAGVSGNWTTGTGTITFASTSPGKTITTAGKTLYNVTFNGVGGGWTMQDAFTASNTVNFTNGTINFASNTTSTVGTFVTLGTTLKYLASSSSGVQATLSQSTGTVNATYLSIKDSNATGGATFDALSPTNINAGNNTGWLFGIAPDNFLKINGVTISSGITIG
jgi:hypothetical protein